LIGYCYNGSYIYHGEFRFTQECHHFINVCKIDWWVDFICASPSGFSCDNLVALQLKMVAWGVGLVLFSTPATVYNVFELPGMNKAKSNYKKTKSIYI
jgi:hypothetical protein